MLIESGTLPAEELMQKDAKLLETLSEPILHLYEMEGRSATYGYFTKPEVLLNLDACIEEKITLAKRPTGGGIIFHFLDLAFSYLIPKGHPYFSENTMENYRTVNTLVMKTLQPLLPEGNFSFIPERRCSSTFCMAHPTPYDLLCDGKKIAGSAQRKTKLGFLHQGTLSIVAPPQSLLQKLLPRNISEAILENSFFFTEDLSELPKMRHQISSLLKEGQIGESAR